MQARFYRPFWAPSPSLTRPHSDLPSSTFVWLVVSAWLDSTDAGSWIARAHGFVPSLQTPRGVESAEQVGKAAKQNKHPRARRSVSETTSSVKVRRQHDKCFQKTTYHAAAHLERRSSKRSREKFVVLVLRSRCSHGARQGKA